jgi:hypothetical protein
MNGNIPRIAKEKNKNLKFKSVMVIIPVFATVRLKDFQIQHAAGRDCGGGESNVPIYIQIYVFVYAYVYVYVNVNVQGGRGILTP